MKYLAALLVTAGIISQLAYSFGKPEHSILESNVIENKDGSYKVQFKIKPKKDIKVTYDAPWSLTLKNAKGTVLTKDKFKKEDFKKELIGFSVDIKAAKNFSFDYALAAFVCTKDKTRCYREVHKGTFKH